MELVLCKYTKTSQNLIIKNTPSVIVLKYKLNPDHCYIQHSKKILNTSFNTFSPPIISNPESLSTSHQTSPSPKSLQTYEANTPSPEYTY